MQVVSGGLLILNDLSDDDFCLTLSSEGSPVGGNPETFSGSDFSGVIGAFDPKIGSPGNPPGWESSDSVSWRRTVQDLMTTVARY